MARRTAGTITKALSKKRYWTDDDARQALLAWEGSGLTLAAFGRQHGIQAKRLYWWRKRLTQESDPSQIEFVEAEVVGTGPASCALELHLSSGARIDVITPGQVDPGWLLHLVRGLSEVAPR